MFFRVNASMGVKRPISFGLLREEVNGREQRKQRFFGFIDKSLIAEERLSQSPRRLQIKNS
jgi:hypothetical protein